MIKASKCAECDGNGGFGMLVCDMYGCCWTGGDCDGCGGSGTVFEPMTWNDAFLTPECGGYYSEKPCFAVSCREGDEYCPAHAALLEAE